MTWHTTLSKGCKCAEMFKSDIHELLCLFAAMVIVETPIITGQTETFTEAALEFSRATNLAPSVNRPRLQMWFAINRDNIVLKRDEAGFEAWLENLMSRVAKIYPAKAVLAALHDVVNPNGQAREEPSLSKLIDKYEALAA